MKQTTAAGMGMAVVFLLLAVLMEGGNPMAFINIPAFLIVIGGTLGAIMASSSMAEAMLLPKLMILALMGGKAIEHARGAKQIVSLAEKARREGLLALESQMDEIDDQFVRKGVQLVVDGTDSTVVEAILHSEIDGMAARHARNAKLFQTLSGFAPTLGILGTVMSLVHVLENLSNPETLGHSIAGAFIATLYGVGSANLVFLPISLRLKGMAEEELRYREMMLAGVLGLQAGDNPRVLAERLETFLEPTERGEGDEGEGADRGDASLKEAA
ncbi:MAG: flagellar motor protein [Gaiellales bacterium]